MLVLYSSEITSPKFQSNSEKNLAVADSARIIMVYSHPSPKILDHPIKINIHYIEPLTPIFLVVLASALYSYMNVVQCED